MPYIVVLISQCKNTNKNRFHQIYFHCGRKKGGNPAGQTGGHTKDARKRATRDEAAGQR